MCKAFSCLVTKSGNVYWKTGLDSHDGLVDQFKASDPELSDDKVPPLNTFCRVEINPKNGNYLEPKQEWTLTVDERIVPSWWNTGNKYRPSCYSALRKWQKQVYSGINLEEARNPIHPFKIKPPRKITKQHLTLLREWASVRDSVGASVRAYISSFFDIEYKHDFTPATKLWEQGLVASFDSRTWRLHSGKKAEIVYEWRAK